jgi:hypothetical protein
MAAHTVHYDAGQGNLIQTHEGPAYRFTLPMALTDRSVVELASFETGVREPTIEDGCDIVRWTEGFEVSVGEASQTVDGQAFPVFNHEMVIKETQTNGSSLYFKLGLVPHLNEVSFDTWNGVSWTGLATTRTVDTSLVFSSSPRTQPPPHYLGTYQRWAALRSATEGQTFPRVNGVCMATHGPLDASASAVLVEETTQPGDAAPPANGATMFTLGATGVAQVAFDTAGQRCLSGGFWACEPWFVDEAVSFLNYQLQTVTNCKDSTANTGDYCNTDGTRPTYSYRFHVNSTGRIELASPNGAAFTLFGTESGAATYAVSNVYSSDASAASSATESTTAYGRGVLAAGCAAVLGFSKTTPSNTTPTNPHHAAIARQHHDGVFNTPMRSGYYSPGAFASNMARALNGCRIPSVAHSHTSNPHALSNVFMLRAQYQTVPVVVSCGARTPFELAEAIGAALTRADTRGATHSSSQLHQAKPTTQLKDADDLAGVDGALSSVVRGRVFYTATYSEATKKFQIQRQLTDTLLANNDASTLPPPLFTALAAPPVDEFTLSFDPADVPTTLAAALGVSAVDTELIASTLGFVTGNRYTSSSNVLNSTNTTQFASSRGTRTQGLVNDVDSNGERPLAQSVLSGPTHRTNELLHCGSGPPNRHYPRWMYAITASHASDLHFTITANHPPVPDSNGKAPNSLASGLTLTLGVTSNIVTTSTTVTSGGTLYQAGDYVVVNDTTAGSVRSPSDAVFKITAVTGNGVVSTIALAYPGSAVTHNPPTTYGYQDATEYNTSTWDAQGPLRILLADGPASTTPDLTAGLLHPRAVVQNSVVQEVTVGTASVPAYRTTGAPLGVRVGDVVEVGGVHQALHLTLDGTNDANKGGTFTVTTATTSTSAALSGVIDTAAFSASANTQDGELYLVQGGDNQGLLRVLDASSDTFVMLDGGTGYVAGQAYVLKGPILESVTALVTDVLQPMLRRTTAAQTNSRFAYLAMRRTTDGDLLAYGTTGRENQLVKLRLPFALQPLASGAKPSNLPFFRHWARPRFSAIRPPVPEDDSVWNTAGLPPFTSTTPASSTTLPFAVDTSASSHNIIVRLVEPSMSKSTQTFVTVDGVTARNVLAKVSYGRMISKTWSTEARAMINVGSVSCVDLMFCDAKLQPFNFRGSTFSVVLKFYPSPTARR